MSIVSFTDADDMDVRCERCNRTSKKYRITIVESDPQSIFDGALCSDCMEEVIQNCAVCDRLDWIQQMTFVDEKGYVCEPCLFKEKEEEV